VVRASYQGTASAVPQESKISPRLEPLEMHKSFAAKAAAQDDKGLEV
jgi:hypothetical protein